MLKPFLIRDLHEDPQSQDIIEDTDSDLYNATDVSVGPQRRHGLVQLAAADYDEIAYIHPQARLSYLDDDDGDIITVGSSLELSQRLVEPFPQVTESGFPATIHIFDIRRRNSVTDLWKRFEYNDRESVPELPDTNVVNDGVDDHPPAPESSNGHDQSLSVENEQPNLPETESSESFLSAFEKEMAKVLNGSQHPEQNAPDSPSSSRTAPAESTTNLPRETAEAFAFALRNLMEVAESIRSGVRAKLPELERHLDNARRTLPGDITDSMRNAFIAFEEQVREMASALNNLPDTIRRENGVEGTRLFADLPTPSDALSGLRELGAQLNSIGGSSLGDLLHNFQNAFWGPEGSPSANVPENTHENATSGPASDSDNQPGAFPFQPQPMPMWWPSGSRHLPPRHVDPFWNAPVAPSQPRGYSTPPTPFDWASETAPQQRDARPDLPTQETLNSESQPGQTLFIGNVGFNVSEKMIKDVFAAKGLQVDVNLPLDSRTNKHAGFGYVNFSSSAEATAGLKELQRVLIDGHCINLEYVDNAPITSLAPQQTPEPNHATDSAPALTPGVRSNDNNDSLASASGNTQPKTSNQSVHDLLLAQTEARFPPVSQLDAHILAEQSGAQSGAPSGANSAFDAGETRTFHGDGAGPSQPLPGSFPQGSHDGSTSGSSIKAQPAHPAHHFSPHPPRPPHPHGWSEASTISQDRRFPETPSETQQHNHPGPSPSWWPGPIPHRHTRRSATMRAAEPYRRSYDPSDPPPGLRRRATERHSLRSGPGPLFPRPRASFHNLPQLASEQPPNSSACEEQSNPRVRFAEESVSRPVDRDIDQCVSALHEMGFGTEEDGGRQRLAIYAAAAKGQLADAIDMIEEERQAYHQRG